MKKLICYLTYIISLATFAQQGINYKAVINETNGAPLANTFMNVQFSIHESTATGAIVYQEDHNYTTDINGLVILNIGSDPTPSIGSFSTLNWGSALHFLQTTITYSGGNIDFDATPFMAVPYALNAANVSGLEKITEGENNGYRLINRDPSNYSSIGQEAVDLSISQLNSEDAGASGFASFASGLSTEASGDYSVAMGSGSIAISNNATAMGLNTRAIGVGATTLGLNTQAPSYAETALGQFNTDYFPANNSAWNANERLFVIGNGESFATKSDALIITKNGTITAPSFDISEITNPKALITKEYLEASSGLVKINEETAPASGIFNSGYRLIDRDATNHGSIGDNAIDLSYEPNASTSRGATGQRSIALGNRTQASGDESTAMGSVTRATGEVATAMGFFTTASGENSTAMGNNVSARSFSETAIGNFNTSYSPASTTSWNANDRLFSIGNGTDSSNRNDALKILKNGTITAPSFDIAEITDDKHLITKEYLEASSGLVKINEETAPASGIFNSGYRLIDRDATNHGSIGDNAIDLSYEPNASTIRGATGQRSVALGNRTMASGDESTAMGSVTIATGEVATAMGFFTTASGENSTAMGNNVSARSFSETAIGNFNTSYSPAGTTSWNANDRLFSIGNGTDSSNRNDALVIYKNGIANFDSEINTTSTGNANMIPIAYGTVESNANVLSGTGNFTASISSGVISISVTGESLTENNTSCSVTPYSTAFRTSSIVMSGGDIDVRTFNSAGNLAPVTFQFVIYKL